MSRIKTNEQFIKEANDFHNNKYSYINTFYKKALEKVEIICPIHGSFKQTPSGHLRNTGCKECRYIKTSVSRKKSELNKKKKQIDQPLDYKLIHLGKNIFTKVDNEDFEICSMYNWSYRSGYVSKFDISIHRFIMNNPKGFLIDHINHDTLDNRRCNLRLASKSENGMNQLQQKNKNKKSKYKGVSWYKRDSKWECSIGLGMKKIYLGRYNCEISAAKAYDEKAKELFGEFAYLNFQ